LAAKDFMKCINFRIRDDEQPVYVYLTPTSLPGQRQPLDEEFVIFSVTYNSDVVLSSHIIGVHAGTRILSLDQHGIRRPAADKSRE